MPQPLTVSPDGLERESEKSGSATAQPGTDCFAFCWSLQAAMPWLKSCVDMRVLRSAALQRPRCLMAVGLEAVPNHVEVVNQYCMQLIRSSTRLSIWSSSRLHSFLLYLCVARGSFGIQPQQSSDVMAETGCSLRAPAAILMQWRSADDRLQSHPLSKM